MLSQDPPFPSSGHSGHSCLLHSRLALGPAAHWAQPAALCQDKTEEESQAPCPLQGGPAPALCLRALAGSLLPAGGTSALLPAEEPGPAGAARRAGRQACGAAAPARVFLSPWGCGGTTPPPPPRGAPLPCARESPPGTRGLSAGRPGAGSRGLPSPSRVGRGEWVTGGCFNSVPEIRGDFGDRSLLRRGR